jgi:hypothetical protein
VSLQQESTGDSYCSGNSNTQQAVTKNFPDLTTSDQVATIINTAALEATNDGTTNGSVLNNSTMATKITVTWNCDSSGKAYTTATATSTDPTSTTTTSDTIRVQLDYSFSMITPFAANIVGQTVHITADESARAEYP